MLHERDESLLERLSLGKCGRGNLGAEERSVISLLKEGSSGSGSGWLLLRDLNELNEGQDLVQAEIAVLVSVNEVEGISGILYFFCVDIDEELVKRNLTVEIGVVEVVINYDGFTLS